MVSMTFAAVALLATTALASCSASKPNFVFIMTDDQDMHLNSLAYQPSVQKHFAEQGTWFQKHFCTVSQCCPSRVSLLTGKAAHNTNVTDVTPPYGGYTKFISQGLNDNYLPIWLQEAGYNTYYTGKLMNSHSTTTYNQPYANGWNGSDFLIDPGTYVYYNSCTVRNNGNYVYNPGQYSTDLIASKAVGFLEDAIAAPDRPFFLGVTPIGPHGEVIINNNVPTFKEPVSAIRHEDLFPDVKVPRTLNFNPDVPGTASYLKSLPQLTQEEVDFNDEFYRKRLQALQAVDDLVDTIMARLEASPEVLANTYIIYTADNGYHLSQHRLPPGKACNIEEDINIPFFIRGPGVPKGAVQNTFPTTHTDIVPTLFTLAGIPLHDDFDGEPIPVTADMLAGAAPRSEHVNVEFWGTNLEEGTLYDGLSYGNNTWKQVRVIGDGYDLAFAVWCTMDHELYDMKADPFQMKSLYGTNGTIAGWGITSLTARLNGLLLTLKACKGTVCTRPWNTLHPQGDVQNLRDAMNPVYDDFYENQQHAVTFSECALGQILAVEGALEPIAYGAAGQRQARWEDWT
ncbi:arylsulfatase precursor [Pestalotiopsis sp. NC0098]|nr:arylsulfatase precursor [Pestalotiopsis sp. NC0098]